MKIWLPTNIMPQNSFEYKSPGKHILIFNYFFEKMEDEIIEEGFGEFKYWDDMNTEEIRKWAGVVENEEIISTTLNVNSAFKGIRCLNKIKAYCTETTKEENCLLFLGRK